MSNFTVCVQYKDHIVFAELYEVSIDYHDVTTERLVSLVRGFNDTFVESFEVYDSEGVVLDDSEVWAIVDAHKQS